jgi:hypothetical protein
LCVPSLSAQLNLTINLFSTSLASYTEELTLVTASVDAVFGILLSYNFSGLKKVIRERHKIIKKEAILLLVFA